jgi:hypothetical protein
MSKISFKFLIEFHTGREISGRHKQHIINSIRRAASPLFAIEVSGSVMREDGGFQPANVHSLLTLTVTGKVNHLRSIAAYSQILQGCAILMLNLSDVFLYKFFIIDS